MKKTYQLYLLIIVMITVGLGFTNCSSNDDDDENSGSSSLCGTWYNYNDDGDDVFVFNEDYTGYHYGYGSFKYKYNKSTGELRINWYDDDGYEIFGKVVFKGTDKIYIYYEDEDGDYGTYIRGTSDNSSSEYKDLIVGTWDVTMDDPSWKCKVTFKSDGTFTSKEYYDNKGDKTFSEYDGTYSGTWKISEKKITIIPYGDSVMDFTGTIKSLTSSSGTFSDSDGWCMYLEK